MSNSLTLPHVPFRFVPDAHDGGLAEDADFELAGRLPAVGGEREFEGVLLHYHKHGAAAGLEDAVPFGGGGGVEGRDFVHVGELFAERRKGKESQVSPIIENVFGWRPASFEEFAMRNAAIFRGEQPAPRV